VDLLTHDSHDSPSSIREHNPSLHILVANTLHIFDHYALQDEILLLALVELRPDLRLTLYDKLPHSIAA
jgi:hypothetical protein